LFLPKVPKPATSYGPELIPLFVLVPFGACPAYTPFPPLSDRTVDRHAGDDGYKLAPGYIRSPGSP
jgi:hypothetical protein